MLSSSRVLRLGDYEVTIELLPGTSSIDFENAVSIIREVASVASAYVVPLDRRIVATVDTTKVKMKLLFREMDAQFFITLLELFDYLYVYSMKVTDHVIELVIDLGAADVIKEFTRGSMECEGRGY
ncbi:MAG: hypothetical protein DRJ40_03530 [Thermoprotei archaeon]|nr:MAG: hypothetical protein DRJ40_03530 [Thermoprotei archaeon]